MAAAAGRREDGAGAHLGGRAPEVSAALGGGQTLAVVYTDTQRLFDLQYPFLTVFSEMAAAAGRREGIDVPAGLLPSARSIRAHLRQGVTAVRRTRAGVEVVSRGTLPGGLSLSTSPLALGLIAVVGQKAGGRTQSTNNLKQIALAMHNYHSNNGRFPPAYRAGKGGKALLSWRVLILPYVEQEALYKEFRLDEPWDSEH